MSLEDRATYLEAVLKEHAEDGIPFFTAVVCNGCGVSVAVAATSTSALRAQTLGWTFGTELGDDDFCPACSP